MEQIVDAISASRLRIGDRLPAERVLATQMAVSRPTIREALKVLARAGVLEVVGSGRGGGAYVRSDFVPPTLFEGQEDLRVSEVAGVLVTRRLLEPRLAQLAAVYATDEDIERLERTIELQSAATGDRARFLALDSRFHLQIAESAHNATIEAVMRVFIRRLELAQDLALRRRAEMTWSVAVADHRRILGALVGRDPDAAEARLFDHLAILEDAWAEESGWALHQKLPDFLLRRSERPAGGANGSADSHAARLDEPILPA